MSIMEQIKALEDRIAKAIEMIKALRAENAQLRTNLSNAKMREEELESIVSSLKSGNDEVENELANAIKIFDDFDNLEPVSSTPSHVKEVKNAQSAFSFSAPQEESLNIQLGPDDSSKDQLNIF
ncbi:MAG: cell division protein ZapB [Spirochaetia bacterium]|nr:cell division protein ZapB [Spirochaetia bacterium]MBR4437274.1 cell division protein ZapB [Spirochaetales bacterium]MBR4796929.1 cell division protein ZapB [Spirochaetia bacterium]MBR5017074.1 cell division protein ZapB [Spirochaetia bacterium]MBR5926917.1 cell division protein ZapB [Spirochaetia bacterium]